MTNLFHSVLKASFQGSIVILAVVLLRLLLKKAPRGMFCLLWLLAGLRLALPFEIQSSLSLQPQLDAPELSIQMDLSVQIPDVLIQNPEEQPLDAPSNPVQTPDLFEDYEDVQSDSFLYKVEDGAITGPITFGDIATSVWLFGMAVMVLASVWSYWKLKHRVREACLIENRCFQCPGLETAFVLGFLPPKIYLPAGLNDLEKKFIFDHENTHIARGDHWYKLLGYLVLSLHWFNPLVWVGYSLLCRDIELACDEQVVRHMSLNERKAYSAALLSCGGRTARFAACPVAFGESNPKQRILNVLNYKRPSFWISLTAVIAVIFVAVCLLTSPKNQEEVSPEEEILWNLKMQVTDVTPTGLTVEFIQHGEFLGSEGAVLRYGNGYTLQVNRGGEWVDVEILSNEESTTWNLVAFPIDLNGTSVCYVNWALRHGQLPTGHYRIGKAVTLFRAAGDYEEQIYRAEFIVYEDTAWEMDLTGEEYLEMCRDAVAEFQSLENYHVRETLVRWISDRDAGREYAAYWRCGDDWARQFYIPVTEEMFSHLCYQGGFFSRYQQEDGSGTWKAANGTDCGTYSEPWLSRLDWDAQKIAFRHVEQVGELLHIYTTVYAAPEFKGYEDAEQYDMGFFFDKDGNLHTAMMGYLEGDVQMISDLRIENTPEANIREKLDQIAADRFAETAE